MWARDFLPMITIKGKHNLSFIVLYLSNQLIQRSLQFIYYRVHRVSPFRIKLVEKMTDFWPFVLQAHVLA